MLETKDSYLLQIIEEKRLVRVYVDDDFGVSNTVSQGAMYVLYEGILKCYSTLGLTLVLTDGVTVWIPVNRVVRIMEIDNTNDAVHEEQ